MREEPKNEEGRVIGGDDGGVPRRGIGLETDLDSHGYRQRPDGCDRRSCIERFSYKHLEGGGEN